MSSLRAEQLGAHLERTLAPAYLIHGDEPLLSLEAADAIRARARKAGYGERSVFIAERGFRWGELAAAGSSMSLFGERQLVELRVPSGKPGSEGAQAIEAWCRALSDNALLLASVPRLSRRDQSASWFTALGKAGVVVEVHPVERTRLPEWIAQRLARQKQRAERDTLQFLADCVEGNLLAAHQEIQKLALLLPEGELAHEAVRAAVLNVARYDAGQLGEAMLGGDAARLARVLHGLRAEDEAPPRIVWILAEEIRAVARIKDGLAAGRNLAELCRENRVWGDSHRALAGRAARRMEKPALYKALAHAARIDRIAKGVATGDTWDELLQLGLRFAQA
ncbi:MAG: DNA polymerase III subunit delta [Burkholderiales bacterium]|nr:DNA polymerase III subunit delta [Burkholderiales bacterium]